MSQESIDKLSKIAGIAPAQETKQVELEPIPDDLFDDEAEIAGEAATYYEEPTPPPVASKKAKPFLTLAAVSGGIFLFIAMVGRGCSSKDVEPIGSANGGTQSQSEAMKAMGQKDAEIEALQRKIDDINAIKTAAAKKDPTPSKGQKANPKAEIAQTASYSPPYTPPYTPPESYSPPTIRASRVPEAPPMRQQLAAYVPRQAPAREDRSEIEALKAQIQQMKLAQAVTPTETFPVQEVANLQESTVAQVDGGIEEQAILSDARIAEVPIGTEARAVLDTPIAGEQSQVIMSLRSDVMDRVGKVTLAKGTKLIGTATNQGGVIQMQLQSAIVDGRQVALPPQGVSVFKADRSPLIAKKLNGGNGFGKVLLGALLDGGGAIASSLTQPKTTSQFSSANGTFSSSTNADSTLGNALVSGGGAIAQSIGGNLKQGLTQPTSGSLQVYGVKAGTELSLIFSAPVQMLTASAALPDESTPALQAEPTVYEQEQEILGLPEQGSILPGVTIQ